MIGWNVLQVENPLQSFCVQFHNFILNEMHIQNNRFFIQKGMAEICKEIILGGLWLFVSIVYQSQRRIILVMPSNLLVLLQSSALGLLCSIFFSILVFSFIATKSLMSLSDTRRSEDSRAPFYMQAIFCIIFANELVLFSSDFAFQFSFIIWITRSLKMLLNSALPFLTI